MSSWGLWGLHTAAQGGGWYHVTHQKLSPGDRITPGGGESSWTDDNAFSDRGNHVWLSDDDEHVGYWLAQFQRGEGMPHLYEVDPDQPPTPYDADDSLAGHVTSGATVLRQHEPLDFMPWLGGTHTAAVEADVADDLQRLAMPMAPYSGPPVGPPWRKPKMERELAYNWQMPTYYNNHTHIQEGVDDVLANGYPGLDDKSWKRLRRRLDQVPDGHWDRSVGIGRAGQEALRSQGRDLASRVINSDPTTENLYRGTLMHPDDIAALVPGHEFHLPVSAFSPHNGIAHGFAGDLRHSPWTSYEKRYHPEGHQGVVFQLLPGAKASPIPSGVRNASPEHVSFGRYKVVDVKPGQQLTDHPTGAASIDGWDKETDQRIYTPITDSWYEPHVVTIEHTSLHSPRTARLAMAWDQWAPQIKHWQTNDEDFPEPGNGGTYYIEHRDLPENELTGVAQSHLDYDYTKPGEVNVSMLYAHEDRRNDGVAEALMRRLHEDHPGYKINPGQMTTKGQAFHDRMLEKEPDARPLVTAMAWDEWAPQINGGCDGGCDHDRMMMGEYSIDHLDGSGPQVGDLMPGIKGRSLLQFTHDTDQHGNPEMYVSGIHVDENHRRDGIAEALMRRMHQDHPDTPINPGFTTDDGQGLLDGLKKRIPEAGEALVPRFSYRLAAPVNRQLVHRLFTEFHHWANNEGANTVPSNWPPLGHWASIESFLHDRYPASHRGLEMGSEEAGNILDGHDPMPYMVDSGMDTRPYETGPEAENQHGYDPKEIAAGMLLLHNGAHSGRGRDVETADWERLHDIAQKRYQMQRTYEQRQASRTAMPTYYHLTDNPDFRPDPNFRPENNGTMGGSFDPGLFVSQNPEHWTQGYGYHRPYVSEIDVPNGVGADFQNSPERFIRPEDYDKIQVKRTLPLDAYTREKWGESGPVENSHGEDFETGEKFTDFAPGSRDLYKKTPGYTYPGTAMDQTPQWREQYENRVRDYQQRTPGIIASRTDT